jgi:hypothetical protein
MEVPGVATDFAYASLYSRWVVVVVEFAYCTPVEYSKD